MTKDAHAHPRLPMIEDAHAHPNSMEIDTLRAQSKSVPLSRATCDTELSRVHSARCVSSMCDTSSPTVREYDRGIRERFAEIERCLSILERATATICARNRAIIDRSRDDSASVHSTSGKLGSTIGTLGSTQSIERFSISGAIGDCDAYISKSREELRELMTSYDFVAVSYLPYGIDNDGAKFKTALLCSNIDSRISVVCDHIHKFIVQIQDLYNLCDTEGMTRRELSRKGSRKSAQRARYAQSLATRSTSEAQVVPTVTSDSIAQCSTQSANLDRTELRVMLRTALGHVSRAEVCICSIGNVSYATGIARKGSGTCTDCGAKMRIMPEASESVCDNCGRVIAIDSSIASMRAASSYIANTTMRSRRSGYNFARHFNIWMDRIQAKESDEFCAEDLAQIRASIISEHISAQDVHWRELTCDDIVRHLSLCRLSYLGEHIPKLVKELGGRAPPIIGYEAEQVIFCDFAHIMEIYAIIFQGPGNKPYYPFFIGKIIKRRFARGSEPRRLLNYIMRQGRDTINRHDKIYERICNAAPQEYDLVYEPEVI